MASLTREPNGNYRIQFVGVDRRRRSVRLGGVNKKAAEEVRLRVEQLNALAAAGLPMDPDTAGWVGRIADGLASKLAAVLLIAPRDSRTLKGYLDASLDRRRLTAKPATTVNLQTVINDLIGFFGEATDLRAVTQERADAFKTHYQTRAPKLALATVARRLRTVKMLFRDAVRWKVIGENPFAGISAKSSVSQDRQHYISVDDALKLIAACDPTWRTIVALSRFAGLRCPSEVLSLKWSDVNFETGRISAPSPKTEHLEGKSYRVLPIFTALRPHLQDAFELAEDGAEYVVGGGYRLAADSGTGWKGCNLRTQLLKIIKRSGLTPWPRLFHNLRASCETDLMRDFPIHVVTAWMGNTPAVALKHYLQVLDRDFDAAAAVMKPAAPLPLHFGGEGAGVRVKPGADSGSLPVQKQAQGPIGTNKDESGNSSSELDFKGLSGSVLTGPDWYCDVHMGRLGVEHSEKTPCNAGFCLLAGAESGSLSALIARWPQLTAEQRETILETAGIAVGAAGGGG